MKRSVIGVYDNGDFIPAIPYIYDGNDWVYAKPYIYMEGWREIGGTGALFYNFLEKTGLYYNSTDSVLVRREENYDNWLDKNNKNMNITDTKVLTGNSTTLHFKLVPREQKFNILKDSAGNILKDTNGSIHTELVVPRRK